MSRAFEVVLGVVVVAVFGVFAYFLMSNQLAASASDTSYVAIFRKVDGLKAGDAVRIGGVTVGRVNKVEVDPETFEVLATLEVDTQYVLTQRAQASVLSNGLLGGVYVALEAGFGEPLEANGYIENTTDALNFTELINQIISSVAFGFDSSGDDQ